MKLKITCSFPGFHHILLPLYHDTALFFQALNTHWVNRGDTFAFCCHSCLTSSFFIFLVIYSMLTPALHMFCISLSKPPLLICIFFLCKFLALFLPACVLFFHITILLLKIDSKDNHLLSICQMTCSSNCFQQVVTT